MNRRGRFRFERIIWLLLLTSALLYGIDFWVFGDGRGICAGFIGNLAFLPLYVLFVTLMIERILKDREREALRTKMNMVIGLFFTEAGTGLLREGLTFMQDSDEVSRSLRVSAQWERKHFGRALQQLKTREPSVDSRRGDLCRLRRFLAEKKEFMLRLLENPNLLEHDEFTDLLWAVSHLVQELETRPELTGLPEPDLDHLSGDIKRVCIHLLAQWVEYMKHLQQDYPYLFSLAIRTSPMDPDARVILGELPALSPAPPVRLSPPEEGSSEGSDRTMAGVAPES